MKSKSILFGHWRRLLFIAFPLLAAITMAMSLTLPSLAATIVNEDIPFSVNITNPCNNESVALSGTEHLVILETFDNNGGVHFDFHANFNITGTGDLGNNYVSNQELHESGNTKVGAAAAATFPIAFELISKGSAPNFLMLMLMHMTFNANGSVTASFDHFMTECQG